MSNQFDVIVIGAGPAGYPAAIRAAQLGLSVVCIDDFSDDAGKASPGGTCLNVGCIPSKALLDSSKHFEHVQHSYAAHGISTGDVSIDVPTMIDRKRGVVKKLTGGVSQLLKANGVEFIHGTAQLEAGRKVSVGEQMLEGKNVILAAGSVPVEIPAFPFDGERIIDNADALELETVPARLGVIGAGVIGLELGSVWRRLGSEVVVLEMMDDFLSAADKDIAKAAKRIFDKQGLDIRLGARVLSAEVTGDKVLVSYERGGETLEESFDRLLVAVGRRPRTDGLLADDSGVTLTDRGFIDVDDDCKTAAAGVWAIGDAVRGPMLAHKGTEEGIAVAERIAGGQPHVNLNNVPWVIYTEPEIAWVGATQQELEEQGREFRSGSFPFAATGRALAMGEQDGMVKMLADAKTDRLLGVHMVGANVSELIAEAVVTMEFSGSSEDLARIVHAHPTLSEAVHEAALATDNRAIHRVNRK